MSRVSSDEDIAAPNEGAPALSNGLNAGSKGSAGGLPDSEPMSTTEPAAPAGATSRLEGKTSPAARPTPWFTLARIIFVRKFLMGWAHIFGMSGLYFLGQIFGTCEFLVDYRRRGRVLRKLKDLFGDDFTPRERVAHARRYFMRIRCDKMFYTIMDRIPRGKLLNRIKFIGREHIDAGLARGKGVYVALCHFGSHYVAGLMMALLGYEISGLRDPKESAVRRFIQGKYRESFPEVARMQVFPANSFPRQVYRRLQNNTIVSSLIDPDRRRGENTKTTRVTMFGEPREILAGPLQIAFRCGSTTVQGFVISKKNFYYQLIVMPPLIDPGREKDDDETINLVAQRYADSVEEYARRHPDHLMNI